MFAAVTPYLRCPVCGGGLAAADGDQPPRALRCPRGHSFDVARQGYVHLGAGRSPHAGDTAAMVAARADFLAAGHYDFISAALAGAAAEIAAAAGPPATAGTPAAAGRPPLVVDAGAGTGRHLAAVLAALPGAVGLALDAAKPAVRRAARAHPRAGAALCDTWARLPVADATAAVLLNVFAPRNGPEFRRVVRPGGRLLVVTPAADHLTELVAALGLLRVDPAKPARVAAGLAGHFAPAAQTEHRRVLSLRRPEVRALVAMGPSAWHADPAAVAARVDALTEPVAVTAAVVLGQYRPVTAGDVTSP